MTNLSIKDMKKSKNVREKNLRNFILYGIFLTISMNLFNPFIGKYLYRLGGTDYHITLYKSLPGIIAVITTLPGLFFINRSKNKKKMMMRFIFASRFIVFLMAAIPFLPKEVQPISLVIIITLRYLPESIGNTAVQSFTGDVFNNKDRATAISSKNRYSVIAQLAVSMVMLVLLRILPDDGKTMILLYQVLFCISFGIAIFEIISFSNLKELENNEEFNNSNLNNNNRMSLKAFIRTYLKVDNKNRNFYIFAVCSLIFHFGWQMGWPLFEIYQLKFLGATEIWLIVFGVISSVVMFFGYKFWNKQIHIHGNNRIIAIATCGMAATPALFALSRNLYVLAGANIITGFFTSGTVTVILSTMLEAAPEENRLIYIGIHATLTSITLAIAPHIGNFFYDTFSIYIALFICSGFRLIGSLSFFIRNKNMSNAD
ncbi:MFS transporter [Oceanirhabdus sp. W0125-5]|uniref:MFS transporter n=1 Tax=Oceanirhabdus sp. W0125-5 TaxID=2999116 RepID=UPI0022F3341A|nr:MFS transporter [Oceanirhabdus sp. W0125-5]WBW95980.1 MFS transporter [Oceanirhabdus sp. W0125-5]